MTDEMQVIVTGLVLFLFGGWLGYSLRLQRHVDEVREWQAIARKAQMLNRIADHLSKERRNGKREHAHQPDGND